MADGDGENSCRRTILIVDDDREFAQNLALLLKGRYLVITAGGSHEALEICRRIRPDAVILDLHMEPYLSDDPEVEGLALLRALRPAGSLKPPVLFLTRGVPDVIRDSLLGLAQGVFTKPVVGGELLRGLDGLLPVSVRSDPR
jgi:DNA-binding response OmpR family regulator